MFKAHARRYDLNIREGETTRVEPATIQGPNGTEPGVAIKTDNQLRYVLRADHAIALCNAIIDTLDEHPGR